MSQAAENISADNPSTSVTTLGDSNVHNINCLKHLSRTATFGCETETFAITNSLPLVVSLSTLVLHRAVDYTQTEFFSHPLFDFILTFLLLAHWTNVTLANNSDFLFLIMGDFTVPHY